jgi:hypothetical protein
MPTTDSFLLIGNSSQIAAVTARFCRDVGRSGYAWRAVGQKIFRRRPTDGYAALRQKSAKNALWPLLPLT